MCDVVRLCLFGFVRVCLWLVMFVCLCVLFAFVCVYCRLLFVCFCVLECVFVIGACFVFAFASLDGLLLMCSLVYVFVSLLV